MRHDRRAAAFKAFLFWKSVIFIFSKYGPNIGYVLDSERNAISPI